MFQPLLRMYLGLLFGFVGGNGRLHRIDPFIYWSRSIAGGFGFERAVLTPLSSIIWEPVERSWPAVCTGDEPFSFFEYSVRIRRHVLLCQQPTVPTKMHSWLHVGLLPAFLMHFWRYIWSARVSLHIMYFMWMIAHAGLVWGLGLHKWVMTLLVCSVIGDYQSLLIIAFRVALYQPPIDSYWCPGLFCHLGSGILASSFFKLTFTL